MPSTAAPLADASGEASFAQDLDTAKRLAPSVAVPTDCHPPPLHTPRLMPNASRSYRSGTHQGLDFYCPRGSPAQAALDGRIVVAVGDYRDPSPADRAAVLGTAAALGATPAYTLVMLYGNYVVVDHGIIDGVGHVVSIYAHLDALAPPVRVGKAIKAGEPVGRIGNTGTSAAAVGDFSRGTHLHWEIHVDGRYLGAGLSESDTRAVYAALFEDASG